MNIEQKISAVSANTRKIFIAFLSAILFSAVTIMNTTDQQLVLNRSVDLPILNLDVSLIVFFAGAPIFIIYIFFYFQLYLRRLKKLTDDAWEDYDEEKRLILIPWLIWALHSSRSKGLMDKIQRIVINFSLWWTMPLIYILFSLWIVKKHDPYYSYIIGAIPAIGTFVVLCFWFGYKKKITNDSKSKSGLNKILRYNLGKISLAFLILVYEIVLLFYIIPNSENIKRFCIDLSYQKLIIEPKTDYKEIYWVNLEGAHLEGANLFSTCLKRADLRKALLQKANICYANLERADLTDSNLKKAKLIRTNLREASLIRADIQNATLSLAKLQSANLYKANLQDAKLNGANLKNAILTNAILKNASLQGADLQEASFLEADLQGAYLRNSVLFKARDLTIVQLSKARTLYQARLDWKLENQIKNEYPHLLKKPKDEK